MGRIRYGRGSGSDGSVIWRVLVGAASRENRRGNERITLTCVALGAAISACVFGANWAITHLGQRDATGVHTIPVGFGWHSPSGVVFVGLALTIRDALQRSCGVGTAVAAILVGSILTLVIAPSLAVASAAAFLVAELSDLAVFILLQRHSIMGAVIASNTVGALVDSPVFLFLAFGFTAVTEFALPQVVGKLEWSVVALPLLFLRRRDPEERDARANAVVT